MEGAVGTINQGGTVAHMKPRKTSHNIGERSRRQSGHFYSGIGLIRLDEGNGPRIRQGGTHICNKLTIMSAQIWEMAEAHFPIVVSSERLLVRLFVVVTTEG